MEKNPAVRRLAAIMFTDMVGYSALSHRSEDLALDLLEEHAKLVRPLFAKHRGLEIKTIGDAFLVEFDSAVEAARCAVEIQTLFHERNAGAPEERRLRLRIGIHVGDIVHQDGDILGDGVNIASRVQGAAQPGAVWVTEDAARQLGSTPDIPLEPLGSHHVKNIPEALTLFRLRLPWERPAPRHSLTIRRPGTRRVLYQGGAVLAILVGVGFWMLWRQSHAPGTNAAPSVQKLDRSIAVMPFSNFSAEKDQEYFCDGMTEQLITNLSRIPELKVIARTSVMGYKGTAKDIRQIGRDLGVAYILEGSVRKTGSELRITAQLIRTDEGTHLWSRDYDRPMQDIFRVQDEVSQAIAETFQLTLSPRTMGAISAGYPSTPEAYEFLMKSVHYFESVYLRSLSDEDFRYALALGQKALDLDPAYVLGYVALAHQWDVRYTQTYAPESLARLGQYAERAYLLNPDLPETNAALGLLKLRKDQDEEAFKLLQRALDLNPNNYLALNVAGVFSNRLGLKDQALQCYTHAIEIDPLSHFNWINRGWVRLSVGRDAEALQDFDRALKLQPFAIRALTGKSVLLLAQGKNQDALALLRQAEATAAGDPLVQMCRGLALAFSGEPAKALSASRTVFVCAALKLRAETLEALERCSDDRKAVCLAAFSFPSLERLTLYDFLRDDQAFQSLLREEKEKYNDRARRYSFTWK